MRKLLEFSWLRGCIVIGRRGTEEKGKGEYTTSTNILQCRE